MNIKEHISNVITKISSDRSILERFQKNPIKVTEEVLGMDLSDDVLNQVVAGVKAKLAGEKVSDIASTLKNLF